jgi:hypothetical protein
VKYTRPKLLNLGVVELQKVIDPHDEFLAAFGHRVLSFGGVR